MFFGVAGRLGGLAGVLFAGRERGGQFVFRVGGGV
jgi:hypothetical protein